MKHYTKRTIVLCLASMLTVIGAFGADNYKNSLVSLKINNGSGGYISMTAFTEKPYNIPVKTVRQDANTYILVYPETNCEVTPPKLNDYENIESINIATYPYTPESDGYTKITIKTLGTPAFRANTTLFIPGGTINKSQNYQALKTTTSTSGRTVSQSSYWDDNDNKQTSNNANEYSSVKTVSQPQEKVQPAKSSQSVKETAPGKNSLQNSAPLNVQQNYSSEGGGAEHSTILICIFALLVIIASIFLISKDKMSNFVGDNNDFDLGTENNDNKKKKSKKRGLRKTINKLDDKYKKHVHSDYKKNYSDLMQSKSLDQEVKNEQINKSNIEESEEIPVIVDLDTLYKEKQETNNIPENVEEDDLADFLNEFKFEEDDVQPEEVINEELYQEIINNDKLYFTSEDIDRINQLIKVELTPEMLENIDLYRKDEALKPRHVSKTKLLENILTTYSISQNIEFSKEDVDVIKQLMQVELDKSFVTDLMTNKNRVKAVEKELTQKKSKPHKTSEILTLNVKGLLPNLSEELKKHGKKPIVSEAKHDVVYFSEGYEYSKLSVASELSDISSALKSKEANEYRPSDFLPIVEEGYDYATLAIKDELPDLEDVKAHPKKYEDKKPEKVKVDENALLKSISNVTFKPFYTDVQTELNSFENFEVIDKNDEFEQYYFNENETEQESLPEFSEIQINQVETESIKEKVYTQKERINDEAEKLLKLIEEQQAQRALKKQAKEDAKEFEKELIKASKPDEPIKNDEKLTTFEYKGKKYNLIKRVRCNSDTMCVLAKSDDGFSVFGQYNGRRKKLKHYDKLSSVNMQVRENEKQNDGSKQYLVKIGLKKFVIKLFENSMEFVMDLC